VILLLVLVYTCTSCRVVYDPTIPGEPTIWVVSETYEDNRLKNGLVGYLIKPVNSGTINMKPVWILDYSGKYYVGQRLQFSPMLTDAARPQK
jgi:hypothetical protein